MAQQHIAQHSIAKHSIAAWYRTAQYRHNKCNINNLGIRILISVSVTRIKSIHMRINIRSNKTCPKQLHFSGTFPSPRLRIGPTKQMALPRFALNFLGFRVQGVCVKEGFPTGSKYPSRNLNIIRSVNASGESSPQAPSPVRFGNSSLGLMAGRFRARAHPPHAIRSLIHQWYSPTQYQHSPELVLEPLGKEIFGCDDCGHRLRRSGHRVPAHRTLRRFYRVIPYPLFRISIDSSLVRICYIESRYPKQGIGHDHIVNLDSRKDLPESNSRKHSKMNCSNHF